MIKKIIIVLFLFALLFPQIVFAQEFSEDYSVMADEIFEAGVVKILEIGRAHV